MKRYILALFAITLLFVSCGEKEEEVAVTSVSLTQATAEMLIGETIQLTATVLPSNATEKTIIWSSSNQSVATVSNNGMVTALSEGTSTVTVSCGGKSATCQVIVSKATVEVTSITLNKEELNLIKGQSETLTATVSPSDATDKTITWSSSTASVVTVDQSGKVTAVAGGNAIITAKAGNYQATCNVNVTVPVESISLNQDNITLKEEQSATLVATIKPDDATDKTVTWTSSDESIAIVNPNGVVNAIFKGTATIRATANDGSGEFVSCAIRVRKPYTAVAGDAVDLGLSVKWSSTNLGATSPTDYGDYFAWGETTPKENFLWETYELCEGSYMTLTKYNTISDYGIVDNKTEFKDYDYEDDAARQALGGSWRIPSGSEWIELMNNCSWTWITNYNGTGINGRLVTSNKNGNSIFLPAAGDRYDIYLNQENYLGNFWSSSICPDYPDYVNSFFVDPRMVNWYDTIRYNGLSVRPVSD